MRLPFRHTGNIDYNYLRILRIVNLTCASGCARLMQCQKSRAPKAPTGSSNVLMQATFAKVVDGRKQPIRGLWVRNERYYAQMTVEDPFNRRKREFVVSR